LVLEALVQLNRRCLQTLATLTLSGELALQLTVLGVALVEPCLQLLAPAPLVEVACLARAKITQCESLVFEVSVLVSQPSFREIECYTPRSVR